MTGQKKPRTLLICGAVLLITAGALAVPRGWWYQLGVIISRGWLILLFLIHGSALTAWGFLSLRRTRPAKVHSTVPVAPNQELKPIPSWAIPTGAIAVAAVTWIAALLLQASVPSTGSALQRAELRVSALRTGLSVGAGVGGAFALLLAFRRQQLAERSQQATEYDAGERRFTELYVKAVEHLGSQKGAVRLAGVYALERLAQDNPGQRQNIIDVICGYLRMPYANLDGDESREQAAKGGGVYFADAIPVRGRRQGTATASSLDTKSLDPSERQVRRTAEQLMTRHLRPLTSDGEKNSMFWPGITIDLTEASLVDADFADCELRRAIFIGCNFIDSCFFNNTIFNEDVRFNRAQFHADARFPEARFEGDAHFADARFFRRAEFKGATFASSVRFHRAKIAGTADFSKVSFCGSIWLSPVEAPAGFRFTNARSFGRPRDVSLPPGYAIESTSGRIVSTSAGQAQQATQSEGV
ncbi:pentapeptide repeat-containing protein [Micromonospora chalcea]|uniref:pentapeptide repeat-containing protein n=1 Tax=Micromonospora chalcea TaxID=1874 RepID=UPI0021A3A15B|nr:pentapeptide repeat-containing protein [Micromonospora chalcea]MCT2280435.1 pentapeptide repeat-containing protein [Micromonospora chalcea]